MQARVDDRARRATPAASKNVSLARRARRPHEPAPRRARAGGAACRRHRQALPSAAPRAPARRAAPPPRRRAVQARDLRRRVAYSIASAGSAAGTASEKWCASSARCGSGSAAYSVCEHFGDAPMEPHPPRAGRLLIERRRGSARARSAAARASRDVARRPGPSIASSSTLSSSSMPVQSATRSEATRSNSRPKHGPERQHAAGTRPKASAAVARSPRGSSPGSACRPDASSSRPSAASSLTISPDEQRIALGLGVELGDELVRRCDARRRAPPGVPPPATEPASRMRRVTPTRAQLGERSSRGVPDGRVDVAERPDDQNPAVRQLRRDEPQEQQRGLVRGVQVVEARARAAARRRSLEQEARRRVEQPEAGRVGLEAPAGLGSSGKCSRSSGTIWATSAAPAAELAAQRPVRPRARTPAATAPRASTRARRRPPSSARRGPSRRGPRPRDQLVRQPALADPGLADEQEEAAAPGERVVEPGGRARPSSRSRPTNPPPDSASRLGRRPRRRRRARDPGRGSPGGARAAPGRARSRARRRARARAAW